MQNIHDALRQTMERLDKARRLLTARTAVADAARALLAKDSTFPRPRREVEEELNTAAIFDIPMLGDVISECEAEIAEMKRQREAEAGEREKQAAS